MASRACRLQNRSVLVKDEADQNSSFEDVGSRTVERKRKIPDDDDDDDDTGISELEKRRRKNIREKQQMLLQLGILNEIEEVNKLASALKKEKEEKRRREKEERERLKKSRPPPEPSRRSARVAGQPAVHYDEESLIGQMKQRLVVKYEDEMREFNFEPEPMKPLDRDNEVRTSLADLMPYLEAVGTSNATSKDSLDSYKKVLQKLNLEPENIKKVCREKLYSLTVHPSVTKTLVITGADLGVVGFWDVSRTDDNAVELFQPLDAPVYCVSVDDHDPSVVYCTAIDGVTRRCNLDKLEFQDLHVNTGSKGHTIHHAKLSPHVLMIACGDGQVKLVDLRKPGDPIQAFKCHSESVRTVQRHPLKEHIFVTASRTRSVSIWDVRKASRQEKPLVELVHPRGLKSAFFSPGGGLLLTTCLDNRLRVYETGHLEGPLKVVMNTQHNINTGRFIRPFQAKWHPLRDDVFIIGSLDHPRKVDIYGIHGLRVHALKSPNLTTILSNPMFHPSLDMIVGHNNSGRVHVFQ